MATLPQPHEAWVAAAIPTQQPDSLGRRTWHLAWTAPGSPRVRGQVSFTTLESIIEQHEQRGVTVKQVSLADMHAVFEAQKAERLAACVCCGERATTHPDPIDDCDVCDNCGEEV